MKWEEIFSGKFFITDLGQEQLIESESEKTILGRYAVWAPFSGNSNHQIIEIGTNLDLLKEKYNIRDEMVCVLVHR